MDTFKISLLLTITSTLLLYSFGLVALIRSIIIYKYSIKWALLALPILLICPPSVFIIITKCEFDVLKNNQNINQINIAKISKTAALLLSILYYVLLIAFNYILKYSFQNPEWYSEISISCDNIVMIFLFVIYFILNRKIKNKC